MADGPPLGGWRLAVAAPGVATSPAASARAADDLLAAFDPAPESVLLVSDSAAWQVGAFGGGDGAVVALGTGAVTVARRGDVVTRLDGLGLLLGDVGGAAWTGRAALQRAAVSTGPLHDAAVARFGTPEVWAALRAEPDLPARLGAFAPEVARLAAVGDRDAIAVLDLAAAGVADTLSAVPGDLPVALVGGFAAAVAPRVQARLPGRAFVDPAGDALDGLHLLLADAGPFTPETTRATGPVRRRHDTDGLATEAVAPGTADLDRQPTAELVRRLVDAHLVALTASRAAGPALTRAVDLVATALRGSGRLVYVGAGTPGRIAVQDAAELLPTFGLDPARAVVLMAGGAAARVRAVENAEDDTAAAVADVDGAGVGPDDVVVGIAASGRTPYVVAAVRRARERGAAVVAVSGVPGSALSKAADVAVDLPTGAEVVAGSTRLAAGTAQKIALNTLSTAALIRAGAVFGPWMTNVVATNDKLRRRSVRIVADAAAVDEQQAGASLAAAEGSVAVALVMELAGLDPVAARARLAAAGGSVRTAVTR